MKKKVYTVLYRRKKKALTNYKRRLSLLKSKSLRLVIRKSNKNIVAQIVKYGDHGDQVLLTVHSAQLRKLGWDINCGNIPAAYATGLLIGSKAKGKQAILDLGLQRPLSGNRLFALVKGAIDGGLKVTLSDGIFPSQDRIRGKHIVDFASKNKDNKQFSKYIKHKDPKKIEESFEKIKKKIIG